MLDSKEMAQQAKTLARTYYERDQLNCAESVLRALMEVFKGQCPPELLKLSSGFGRGMGAGCACGALVGSVMAVGALFGRTEPTGRCPKETGVLSKAVHDAFREHFGATCCRILHRGLPFGTPEQKASCATRTAEAAEQAAMILAQALNARETLPSDTNR